MASQYHYTVTFDGIAPGPEGTEHLGCCSQVAVFERISSSVPADESGIGQPYNLVLHVLLNILTDQWHYFLLNFSLFTTGKLLNYSMLQANEMVGKLLSCTFVHF